MNFPSQEMLRNLHTYVSNQTPKLKYEKQTIISDNCKTYKNIW